LSAGRAIAVARGGLLYFGIVFGAGFVLGTLRVALLVPMVGVRAAELAEMPIMLIVIVLGAGFVVRRDPKRLTSRQWAAAGLIALALLLAAEIALSVMLTGQSIGDYVASRDPVSGSVYALMLIVYAAMPWLRFSYGVVDTSERLGHS